MQYVNDKAGRDEVLGLISRLTEQGYIRRDVENEKVVLSKLILSGKFCKRSAVKEFVFNKDEGVIVLVEKFSATGLDQARGKLYGMTAGVQEANNAVRAGVLDQADYDILMLECGNEHWWHGGETS